VEAQAVGADELVPNLVALAHDGDDTGMKTRSKDGGWSVDKEEAWPVAGGR
jgi:hypothetical protein